MPAHAAVFTSRDIRTLQTEAKAKGCQKHVLLAPLGNQGTILSLDVTKRSHVIANSKSLLRPLHSHRCESEYPLRIVYVIDI